MSKQIEQAIVRVQDPDGGTFGSGFLVCCNQILTCAHVVADSLGISRETQETPTATVFLNFPMIEKKVATLPALVKFWDTKSDIALLELLTDVPETAVPIELEAVDDYSFCDFSVCGFPNDMGDWTYGKMLGKIELGYIQIESKTAHRIQGGYSGGPVWHRTEGRLAGMVVASDEVNPEDKTAYIIPVSVLLKFLPHLKIKTVIKDSHSLKYACFISYPNDTGQQGQLVREIAEAIYNALSTPLSAMLELKDPIFFDKEHFHASDDLAKAICESACFIMIFTPKYFSENKPLCALEYKAMQDLEAKRILFTGNLPDNLSFIIPVRPFSRDVLPMKAIGQRHDYDFRDAVMLDDLSKHPRFGLLIKDLAEHIYKCYHALENCEKDPCGECSEFRLPGMEQAQDLFSLVAPRSFDKFPIRH